MSYESNFIHQRINKLIDSCSLLAKRVKNLEDKVQKYETQRDASADGKGCSCCPRAKKACEPK